MSGLMKVIKSLPAESIIVFANVSAVTVWGTKMFYDNLKKMEEENHFELVKEEYVTPLERLRERGHEFERSERKTVL